MPADYTPQRVVCLQPSATLTMRDIGMLDRVVACTRYCADVCPEVADGSRIIVADSWTAQTQEIVSVRPDLVIASVPYQMEAVAAILKAGVRFLGLAPRTLNDIYGDIQTIAGAIGVPERGSEAVHAMQSKLADISGRCLPAKERPRVFCEEWGRPLIASQPWVAELVEMAGGSFVGGPGKAAAPEEIASANPDILIAAWCGAGDRVPLEKLVDQRQWHSLPAVQNGKVYCISDELLNTPATSLSQGMKAIAWALHPDLVEQPRGIRPIGANSSV